LKQIKTLLGQNKITIAKAGEGRTMIIIHKDTLKQKIRYFYRGKSNNTFG